MFLFYGTCWALFTNLVTITLHMPVRHQYSYEYRSAYHSTSAKSLAFVASIFLSFSFISMPQLFLRISLSLHIFSFKGFSLFRGFFLTPEVSFSTYLSHCISFKRSTTLYIEICFILSNWPIKLLTQKPYSNWPITKFIFCKKNN